MSIAFDLIERAYALGVVMTLAGDSLKWRAPQPLPADLLEEMRQHKAELLAALSQPIQMDKRGLPFQLCQCGSRSFWKPAGGEWRCQDCAPYTGRLQTGAMTCTLPAIGWPVLSGSNSHARNE